MSEVMSVFEGEPKEIIPKLKKLLELKKIVTDLDKTLKEAKSNFNALEEKAFIMMEQEGIQNLNIKGKLMYRNVQTWASVRGEKKEDAYDWLKTSGFEDLFYETLNSRTLTSVIRDFIKEGGEVPVNLINLKVVNKIGIRKA